MNRSPFTSFGAGEAIPRERIPRLTTAEWHDAIVGAVGEGCRTSALFGDATSNGEAIELYVVLSEAAASRLHLAKTSVRSDEFASLVGECPQVHLFEREIAEQLGLRAVGHPWFKPVRFHRSYRSGHDAWGRAAEATPAVGVVDYYRIEGDEIHEVAVGPVHAGVIEPGHFRFQCHGETVFHLEISLGYQHRGVEPSLLGGPTPRTVHAMETVAGDTSIGHVTAYCQAVEALGGCIPPPRALWLRAIALELERLANHCGDLGALANDVAFLPTAAYCGRLRGDFLNLSALLCGSRFGRSMVRPGGVGFDVDESRKKTFVERLDAALRDVAVAANLLFKATSVQVRFEGTGVVSREDAIALGLVGPAGRASGVDYDVRTHFATGAYRAAPFTSSTWPSGDVYARAYIRWLEIQRSVEYIRARMADLPEGPIRAALAPLRPDSVAIALAEGWRGEICHVALTDAQGKFSRYKIVDPSFHNWSGLAMALRNEQISNFPLCNKSFNLSYCGYDL